MAQIIQCAPNFSEGRRPEVIAAIVNAVRETAGVRLADWSADVDHNRLVVTFLGEPEAVCQAALASSAAAIASIDLRAHSGAHPRLGAIDVLPLVPLSGITLDDCAALAVEIGRALAARFSVPVFLYEAASPPVPEGTHPNSGGVRRSPTPNSGGVRALPDVRRGAFRTLMPDFGPSVPHPTAGAVVVGARGPLIAYNINLTTSDARIARTIARELREGGGSGLVGVRALGLFLESRGLAQVSMNITRPAETSLLSVFAYITRRAEELGSSVLESEVIGALPGVSAFRVIADALKAQGLKPGQILLENWPEG